MAARTSTEDSEGTRSQTVPSSVKITVRQYFCSELVKMENRKKIL